MSTAFHLEDVALSYDGRCVLDVADLTLPAGGLTALVGPNGAGKTTLLHMLALLVSPDRGHVEAFGESVTAAASARLRRRIGLVQQNPYLLRGSVRHNVEIGLRLRRVDAGTRRRRVDKVADTLGIGELLERSSRAISGGERQKVAIARTLVLEPEVLLLDEPFTHLDRRYVAEIERLLTDAVHEHTDTVVFSTHDTTRAHALADRVISVIAGQLRNGSLVNVFHGRLDGDGTVFDTGRLRIHVDSAPSNVNHAAIEPEHVVLSPAPLESSMRNTFEGRVVGLGEDRGRVTVTVDAGERFRVVITHATLEEPWLAIGRKVWVSFKSTAVELL